jgi:hypothetical protein
MANWNRHQPPKPGYEQTESLEHIIFPVSPNIFLFRHIIKPEFPAFPASGDQRAGTNSAITTCYGSIQMIARHEHKQQKVNLIVWDARHAWVNIGRTCNPRVVSPKIDARVLFLDDFELTQ